MWPDLVVGCLWRTRGAILHGPKTQRGRRCWGGVDVHIGGYARGHGGGSSRSRDGASGRAHGAPAHRYAHVKVIGEGATGDVMLAEDRDIDRPVAIKRLRPELSSRAALARFAQEVRTVGRLEHPNIAPVHDVGIDEAGRYYFVMKYIQGETLEQVIDRLGSGDPEAHRLYTFEYRTQVFIKILEAIEFAHAHGVLHRDIKPSNVMIGPYGEVMVMDWGVARCRDPRGETSAVNVDDPARQGSPSAGRASDARSPAQRARETTADMLVGTPAYMSPEQALADNDKVDERSDVYALCALFYEFLALRYYLTGAVGPDSALTEKLMAVVLETPPRPDTLVSEHQTAVPRELSFFVMRGLEKDRDRRFSSVRAMIDELKADLDGQTCAYCASTALKRGVLEYAHLLDRHRRFGVVLAVTVTVLATAGVVARMRLLLRFLDTVILTPTANARPGARRHSVRTRARWRLAPGFFTS